MIVVIYLFSLKNIETPKSYIIYIVEYFGVIHLNDHEAYTVGCMVQLFF